ncbi:dienelactone hydrolase family protein [uncultured Jannaschia sp.]|uniref:dienelactone hydrolase family protein n=1 Tax=uncultured Jannaschia sp. TaxID=293347 RepID=UPI0026360CFB|nr:dienelactone hydrolase family protein [uncultured Jannaschia sp.]
MGDRIDYAADGATMRGYRARPDSPNGAALLVMPAFAGLRDFEMAQADRFAAMGYDVLGVDYYGDGWTAADMNEASQAMQRLNTDRPALLRRTEAALDLISEGRPVGAVGFCFGAKAVLDLSRSGHLDAAVSLHGIYDRPPTETRTMPPVLLCHGWNDPLATPADFGAMAEELESHSPDWHALCFGQTGHAFTNPDQGEGNAEMGYVAASAERTQAAVDAFFARTLIR